MARSKNDGRGRIGGRAKGTPNKVTSSMRDWLAALLSKNRKQIETDLKNLAPSQRLVILERFMQYTIPKQSAIRGDLSLMSDEQLNTIIQQITKDI